MNKKYPQFKVGFDKLCLTLNCGYFFIKTRYTLL